MIWREFKAMGTDIVFLAFLKPEQQNILEAAEYAVHEFEKRFSRFIPGNELATFNEASDEKVVASDLLVEMLRESLIYNSKTNGIFDPTVISSLEAIGYDRSFSEIKKDENTVDLDKIKKEFSLRKKVSDIKIKGNLISKLIGLKIDLGGIGKGYIVDFLSNKFFSEIDSYWISAGGDILANGNQKDSQGWDIGVQNPLKPEENIFFINTHGKKTGIATSGIIKRQGIKGDYKWNHIIDPRTGLSVDNEILSVTVISSSAVRADIYAKTVLVLGELEGVSFIENENDSACIIFKKNGDTIFSKRAEKYLKK